MKQLKSIFNLTTLMFISMISWSQEEEVTITIDSLTNEVFMLTGQGGNIGLFVNATNTFMIDDQFARLSPKIKQAIATITNQPITYLFNTHMHGDHTGGNAEFNSKTTTLIAQDNVRKSLEQRIIEKPELNNDILPEISFSEELTLYQDDETIMAFHVHNAHTNGDAMIYFIKNNVIHMGDTYFSGRYPYIDINNGGSVNGYINAQKKALMLIDDNTIIIPGHGRPSNKQELTTYITMLEDIKDNTLKAIELGRTLEQITTDTTISGAYDTDYGTGFINPERLRSTFYTSLKK
ncbi:MBL fold metallo-hydrolase [uncultured Maribacter sp.]|uniref:MBL fold metallo-hydrolase n=1 Tax=uncultured Maribacter sp. TaxID=431308 RepID=UPI0030EB83A7|tara:strand:- start:26008 stop:26886 length:879 start_codon:yes stop_codon:yes gene_type:complete